MILDFPNQSKEIQKNTNNSPANDDKLLEITFCRAKINISELNKENEDKKKTHSERSTPKKKMLKKNYKIFKKISNKKRRKNNNLKKRKNSFEIKDHNQVKKPTQNILENNTASIEEKQPKEKEEPVEKNNNEIQNNEINSMPENIEKTKNIQKLNNNEISNNIITNNIINIDEIMEENSSANSSNYNKNKLKSYLSSSSYGKNFVLKKEVCNSAVMKDHKNVFGFFSDGKYSNPMLTYYKDYNSQNFVNFYLFTERKSKELSKEGSYNFNKSDNDFFNKNNSSAFNIYTEYGRKSQNSLNKIITDVINEDEEENCGFNLNALHGGNNNEEKTTLENKIKQIIFDNIDDDKNIKEENEIINNKNENENEYEEDDIKIDDLKDNLKINENLNSFDYYLNQNLSNNKNYLEKNELNKNKNNNNNNNNNNKINNNNNNQNVAQQPFNYNNNINLNNNIYNIYKINPMAAMNPYFFQYKQFQDKGMYQNNYFYNFYNNNNLVQPVSQLNDNKFNLINKGNDVDKIGFIPKNYIPNDINNKIKESNNNNLEQENNKNSNPLLNKNYLEYSDEELGKMAHILLKDQDACRYLQDKIKNNSDFANNIIFPEIKDYIKELSCDPFGNYFFQLIVDILNFENINSFLDLTQKYFSDICNSPHGTRVIQKLIDKVSPIPLLMNKLIYNLCSKDLGIIFKSPYGNHVIQKFLITANLPEYLSFIYNYTFNNFLEIAMTKHGVCVIQKCVTVGDEKQRLNIYNLIIKDFDKIIKDQFGNYLVQYILINNSKNIEKYKEILPLIRKMEENIIDLCKFKFSANVFEKCFEDANNLASGDILEYLLKNFSNKIIEILNNQFGIYVLQKAIKFCDGKYKMQIFKIIQEHENEINYNDNGNIYKIIENHKELGEMLSNYKGGNVNNIKAEENNDNRNFKRDYNNYEYGGYRGKNKRGNKKYIRRGK